MTAPESLPSPRGAHLEMVGAVLAGDGLERVAEIAAAHAGAPVAVIVPRLGAPVEAWAPLRALRGQAAGRRQARAAAPRSTAEVPIVSGGQELGAVLLLGKGRRRRRRVPARGGRRRAHRGRGRRGARRDRAEPSRLLPRGAAHPRRPRPGRHRAPRRAGWAATSATGAVGLCADPGERAPGRLLAAISGERPGALAQTVGGRVYALLPGRRRRGPPGGQPARRARRWSACRRTTPTRPTSAARSRRPSSCWA